MKCVRVMGRAGKDGLGALKNVGKRQEITYREWERKGAREESKK